jgi:hypothetical protein
MCHDRRRRAGGRHPVVDCSGPTPTGRRVCRLHDTLSRAIYTKRRQAIPFSDPEYWSGNHAAFKHLVGNRRRHLVEKGRAHLRIVAQHLYRLLLSLGLRLALLLGFLLP